MEVESSATEGRLATLQEEDTSATAQESNGAADDVNADDAMDSDAAVSHGDDEAAAASSAAAQAAEQSAVAATLATLASNGAQQQQQQPPPHASPVGPNPAPLPANYDKDQPICANCSTQTTPLWRRSQDSNHILCNACALFFKMKGRPRPISLKTDVIKSRNRSKGGKSTSKDRGVGGKTTKDRGESTSRSRGDDTSAHGKKELLSGAEDEDHEMSDGRGKAPGESGVGDAEVRKSRKAGPSQYGMMPPMPGYPPGAYPYPYGYPYPHPHQPHPHAHQPYPLPPRSRSRSTDSSRRTHSQDARGSGSDRRQPPHGMPQYGYPPPPPAGYHPGAPGIGPEGYAPFPGYPPYGASYPGQPPFYPPNPHYPHPHGSAIQPPSITHAQSNSRSRSPATPAESEQGGNSARSSVSPPLPHAGVPQAGMMQMFPHPQHPQAHLNPAFAAMHQPYAHSPLGAAHRLAGAPNPATSQPVPVPSANVQAAEGTTPSAAPGAVTLAPLQRPGVISGSNSPKSSQASSTETVQPVDQKQLQLPSIGSVTRGGSGSDAFTSTSAAATQALLSGGAGADVNDRRLRGASVSSASAASVSDDGLLRSPESTTSRSLAGVPSNGRAWTAGTEDERRGRPERRFHEDDGHGSSSLAAKGKGRDFNEIDELDEGAGAQEDGDLVNYSRRRDSASGSGSGSRSGSRRMMGVETGLGELRVQDQQWQTSGSPVTKLKQDGSGSSRSRSSGHREEQQRGRSRGHAGAGAMAGSGGRSGSTSRASRALTTGSTSSADRRSSSSGRYSLAAEAEITRLKSKVSELTFLNGLLMSRLRTLDGSVPVERMTSLTAETPRPDPEMEEDIDGDILDGEGEGEGEEQDELDRFTKDPETRQSLLLFLKAQAANGTLPPPGAPLLP